MRARNIKPGFFKNAELLECDPLTRILFAGLWCMADRSGRLEDRPRQIKIEVLPGDDCDVDAMLWDLHRRDFLVRYECDGKRFLQVKQFLRHQNPHVREPKSLCPAPDEHSASTVQAPDEHRSGPADSPFLIPDSPSLIPLSPISDSRGCVSNETLSGKPDPAPRKPKPEKPEPIPYEAIIDRLNAKTGKQYKASNQQTRKLIEVRWKEGFRLEDFRCVIDTKVEKWGHDPKMCDYLRPVTLFGTKFEAYLNEARGSPDNGTGDMRKMFGKAGLAAMEAIRIAKGMTPL